MIEVFAVETLTGRLGPLLQVSDGKWSDNINESGSITAKVPTPWLLSTVERWYWSPWTGSLLVCRDGEPVAFGPIIKEPSGDRDYVDLEAGDLWDILEHRMVTPDDITDGAALAKASLTIDAGSLGTIARRLVETAQKRPTGWCPVSYGSPEELGTARTRTYKGFNLGNNSVAKRLKELTEVINGPDISFRPRWVERGVSVEWVMVHGTEGMPEIAQDRHYTVDMSAPRSNASAIRVSSESLPIGRVYATGAGQDEGTLIRVATAPTKDRLPLLESVTSDTQAENADLLQSRAEAGLKSNRTVQITAAVDDPAMPLHTWWAGDQMTVVFPDGWPQIAAGAYRMRILRRSGNFATSAVDVEFTPEEIP